jgi:hypothetical protein
MRAHGDWVGWALVTCGVSRIPRVTVSFGGGAKRNGSRVDMNHCFVCITFCHDSVRGLVTVSVLRMEGWHEHFAIG